MCGMVTSLLVGAAVLTATLTAAVVKGLRNRTAGDRACRSQRATGADPYAGKRKPDKLNPGLGGFGAGGG